MLVKKNMGSVFCQQRINTKGKFDISSVAKIDYSSNPASEIVRAEFYERKDAAAISLMAAKGK